MTAGEIEMLELPASRPTAGSTEVVDLLRASMRGEVITPSDPPYDELRGVVYGGFDLRPAAIARPVDAADVAAVIGVSRDTGVGLAVRSGGHSNAGHSSIEGGIVLDVRDLRDLEIDVAGRTAWAGAGLSAGDVTTALVPHGLAVGFGDTASVGIGGITLGGGVGYLVRKH
jgi:FAD/FMN-containing dehydrogenase